MARSGFLYNFSGLAAGLSRELISRHGKRLAITPWRV
jgi:hypothetical protein